MNAHNEKKLTKEGDYFDPYIDHVKERLSECLPSRTYLLKEIVIEEVWDFIPDGEKRSLDRKVSHLVSMRQLPLIPVLGKHEFPKRYQLI